MIRYTLVTLSFVYSLSNALLGQTNQAVIMTDSKPAFENTSYLVVESLTLTDGFHVTASIDGDWSAVSVVQDIDNSPPSLDQHFVRTESAIAATTDELTFAGFDYTEKMTSFSYFDGLGRATQTILNQASPSGQDIVQPYVYNPTTGLQEESRLPYTYNNSNPGEFRANSSGVSTAITEQEAFYNNSATKDIPDDLKPYSTMVYEESPLQRPESATGVGATWHDNSKQINYHYDVFSSTSSPFVTSLPPDDSGGGTGGPAPLPNTSLTDIRLWEITAGANKELDYPSTTNKYIEGELLFSVVTNENGIRVAQFRDTRGRNVANATEEGEIWLYTYYVYDDFNQLRFIIPSALTGQTSISTFERDGYLFQYIYDERRRLIKEKSPDADWVYYCYDKWDRLVMSQDGAQRVTNDWTFFKYDVNNRLIMTGRKNQNTDPDTWWSTAKTSTASRNETVTTTSTGYSTNLSLPTSYNELYTITYYDNYNFKSYSGWDAEGINFDFNADGLNIAQNTLGVKGMTTGSKVKNLSDNSWINTVVYYDHKYRNVQIVAENHLGGYDRLSSEYTFAGDMIKSKLSHFDAASGSADLTYEQEYDYDVSTGLLLKTWSQINSEPQVLTAEYRYNELGDLTEKNLHSTDQGSSFLQSVDYRYNIRGWLSSINHPGLTNDGDLNDDTGDLFGAKYHYSEDISLNGATIPARYDGSMNAIEWKNDNNQTNTFSQSIFGYQYDDLGRLTDSKYASGGGTWTGDAGDFDVAVSYADNNGNINTLTRKEHGTLIDDLDYRYETNSNKLQGVHDNADATKGFVDRGAQLTSGTEYNYDAPTGNFTSDENKEITDIEYNHLQLVDRIVFFDNTEILYAFDAVGNRLSKTLKDANGNVLSKIDYVGAIEYLDDEIDQLYTSEGRAYEQNGSFHYEYMITDHQANNRVSFGNLPDRHVYTTGLEAANDTYFDVPANVRQQTENHTPLGQWSAHLNKAVGRTVGPAKVLDIAAGDVVSLETWAKATWSGSATLIGGSSNVSSILTSTLGVTGSELTSLSNALSSPSGGMFVVGGASSTEPDAYLQWIYLDDTYSFITAGFSALPSTGSYQKLSIDIPASTLNQAGYLYVYVANETDLDTDVFFDDLRIVHEASPTSFKVTQINDYYPYGMPMNSSWRDPGHQSPGMLYQSYFADYDSITGTSDFLLRNYDASIGRWWQTDPYNQFANPYAGMGNVPNMGVDPDGGFLHYLIEGAIAGAIFNTALNYQNINKPSDFAYYALAGAAAGTVSAGIAAGIGSAQMGGTFKDGVLGKASGFRSFTTSALRSGAIGFSGGATYGFLTGTSNSLYNGKDLNTSIKKGGKTALIYGGIGLTVAGAYGGIDAYFGHRNFWTGAVWNPVYVSGDISKHLVLKKTREDGLRYAALLVDKPLAEKTSKGWVLLRASNRSSPSKITQLKTRKGINGTHKVKVGYGHRSWVNQYRGKVSSQTYLVNGGHSESIKEVALLRRLRNGKRLRKLQGIDNVSDDDGPYYNE